jgi:hypothetical protein
MEANRERKEMRYKLWHAITNTPAESPQKAASCWRFNRDGHFYHVATVKTGSAYEAVEHGIGDWGNDHMTVHSIDIPSHVQPVFGLVTRKTFKRNPYTHTSVGDIVEDENFRAWIVTEEELIPTSMFGYDF